MTFGESEVGYDFAGHRVVRSLCNVCADGGWNIDHILPRAHGGRDVLENMQICSVRVNSLKGHDLAFEIDGVVYEIKRCAEVSEEDWSTLTYNYDYKDFCIIKRK